MTHDPTDDQQPAPRQFSLGAELEALRHDLAPSLLEMVDHAIARLLDNGGPESGSRCDRSAYSQAFPVGEALGRSFRQRCLGKGPFGLANLIERMTEAPASTAPTERAIRRGLFSGFCWELERGLGLRQPAPESGDEESL